MALVPAVLGVAFAPPQLPDANSLGWVRLVHFGDQHLIGDFHGLGPFLEDLPAWSIFDDQAVLHADDPLGMRRRCPARA